MIATRNSNTMIPSVEVTDTDDVINNNIAQTIVLNAVVDDVSPAHSCSSNHDNPNVLCLSNNTIDLFGIPMSALGRKCLERLSLNLNAIKVILSEDGVQRDWRGVFHYLRLETVTLAYLQTKDDPMGELLKQWKKDRVNASMGELRHIIGAIDRWDVVDDTSEMFVEDAKAFLKKQTKPKDDAWRNSVEMVEQKNYDVFILGADEDTELIVEIMQVMESHGIEVCVKGDLLGGAFEHEAIMEMIRHHCHRVILVLTPAFIESPNESFYALIAQAAGIASWQRKVVPCLFGGITKAQLPTAFQYYHVLKYEPEKKYNYFWEQLVKSVKSPSSTVMNRTSMPKITITETDAPSPSIATSEQPPQPQKASVDSSSESPTPQPLPRKRKENSSSPKLQKPTKSSSKLPKAPKISSPTTPSTLRPFWPPSPKLRSQPRVASSMLNLSVNHPFEKENKLFPSTLSLNSADSSPASTLYKKPKWYKKLLSPNSGSANKLSADSDSSMGMEKGKKKKSWRKRFRSKTRIMAKEV